MGTQCRIEAAYHPAGVAGQGRGTEGKGAHAAQSRLCQRRCGFKPMAPWCPPCASLHSSGRWEASCQAYLQLGVSVELWLY